MPKVSTVAYDPSSYHANDTCMHWKLPFGPGCDEAGVPRPYPPHTAAAEFYRGLSFGVSTDADTDVGAAWNELVLPRVESAIGLLALLARHGKPLHLHRLRLARGLEQRRFLHLSIDLVVDESARVYVVDVNANGRLPAAADQPFWRVEADLASLLRLLGAAGVSPRRDPGGAPAATDTATLRRFCAQAPAAYCSPESQRAIMETLEEEVNGWDSAWYRTFPSMLTDAHEELQRLSPALATPLDTALAAFLRFRAADAAL